MPTMKYSYGDRSSAYSVKWRMTAFARGSCSGVKHRAFAALCEPLRGQCEAGSLTGAVHLSNDNAGVPRPAQ